VVAVEGAQAADLVAFNAIDYRESLCTWLTRHMSGSFAWADQIYTKLPAGRVMFDVEHAQPGVFWLSSGRCNRLKYEKLGKPWHANCQDILAATIEPYGLDGFDVPDVLNLFMNPRLHPGRDLRVPRLAGRAGRLRGPAGADGHAGRRLRLPGRRAVQHRLPQAPHHGDLGVGAAPARPGAHRWPRNRDRAETGRRVGYPAGACAWS
jgi:hypothetical protein